LIRPSIKAVELSSGHTAAVDTSLSKNKNVLLAAIGSIGNFSSNILSESHLSLFTTEQPGKQSDLAEDISKFLQESGFPTENGLVVVRSSTKSEVRMVSERVVEVSVIGELKLDHVLSLLSTSNPETK
jgi:dihydroxyacetone kinase